MEGWGDSTFWFMLGITAQTAFFSRFLVQWIASERAGRSVVPIVFWYLSLAGSLMLLVYAIHRKEPIFALGQSVGGIVYIRNLVLLKRHDDRITAAAGAVAKGDGSSDNPEGRGAS